MCVIPASRFSADDTAAPQPGGFFVARAPALALSALPESRMHANPFITFIRRALGIQAIEERLDMIHPAIQAQIDRMDAFTNALPGVVTQSVAAAEAAKDADLSDDVTALTAAGDRQAAALSALTGQPASEPTPQPESVSDPAPQPEA